MTLPDAAPVFHYRGQAFHLTRGAGGKWYYGNNATRCWVMYDPGHDEAFLNIRGRGETLVASVDCGDGFFTSALQNLSVVAAVNGVTVEDLVG